MVVLLFVYHIALHGRREAGREATYLENHDSSDRAELRLQLALEAGFKFVDAAELRLHPSSRSIALQSCRAIPTMVAGSTP